MLRMREALERLEGTPRRPLAVMDLPGDEHPSRDFQTRDFSSPPCPIDLSIFEPAPLLAIAPPAACIVEMALAAPDFEFEPARAEELPLPPVAVEAPFDVAPPTADVESPAPETMHATECPQNSEASPMHELVAESELTPEQLIEECLAGAPAEPAWNLIEREITERERLVVGPAETAPPPQKNSSNTDTPAVAPRSDEYRELRDNILRQLPRAGPLAIALVSAEPNREHVLLAARLTLLLAEESVGDVLAIDADSAPSELACHLDFATRPSMALDPIGKARLPLVSLSELLQNGRSVEDAALATPTRNVWVIPGSPSEGDGTLAIDPLFMNHCKRRYSHVVIAADTANSPITIPLARQCDAAYLVVDLGRSDRQASLDAIVRLKRGGVVVRGCIVTGAPAA
jgi:hypothetical protein